MTDAHPSRQTADTFGVGNILKGKQLINYTPPKKTPFVGCPKYSSSIMRISLMFSVFSPTTDNEAAAFQAMQFALAVLTDLMLRGTIF